MIPTKTIIGCLREYAKSSEWHLRRIMLEAAKRLEADKVEVPCRCKDCRKCAIYDDVITKVKQYVCRAQNGHREVDADAFCSYGERKN